MDELEQAARRNAEKSIAENLILFIFLEKSYIDVFLHHTHCSNLIQYFSFSSKKKAIYQNFTSFFSEFMMNLKKILIFFIFSLIAFDDPPIFDYT